MCEAEEAGQRIVRGQLLDKLGLWNFQEQNNSQILTTGKDLEVEDSRKDKQIAKGFNLTWYWDGRKS